jgi:signal transduction histidine kinase
MKKSNSHAFLSSLIDSPSDIIIVSVDSDFNYTFFNSAHKKEMKKVWGVDIERGSNFLDYIPSDEEILQLIEQTIKETRTLTFELSPPILYELGLSQAIKWLIDEFREKYNLKISLKDDGRDKPFNNNIRFFIFQAVRELLVNIVKHSQAKKANIMMLRANDKLRITVEDDGIGYASASV